MSDTEKSLQRLQSNAATSIAAFNFRMLLKMPLSAITGYNYIGMTNGIKGLANYAKAHTY
jgi:hypothetical protein